MYAFLFLSKTNANTNIHSFITENAECLRKEFPRGKVCVYSILDPTCGISLSFLLLLLLPRNLYGVDPLGQPQLLKLEDDGPAPLSFSTFSFKKKILLHLNIRVSSLDAGLELVCRDTRGSTFACHCSQTYSKIIFSTS